MDDLMHAPWKREKRDVLHTTEYHSVLVIDYRLPNGSLIKDHLLVAHPDWVNFIVTNEYGKIAMVEQYRPGIRKITLELPGGIVQNNLPGTVASEKAVIDEMREELGRELVPGSSLTHFMTMSPNPSTHSNYCRSYIANQTRTLDSGTEHETTELLKVTYLSPSQVFYQIQVGNIVAALSLAPLMNYIYIHRGA